jgi:hypothetical protein
MTSTTKVVQFFECSKFVCTKKFFVEHPSIVKCGAKPAAGGNNVANGLFGNNIAKDVTIAEFDTFEIDIKKMIIFAVNFIFLLWQKNQTQNLPCFQP